MIRCIKIDSKSRTISEVEINDNIQEIKQHVECQRFDIVNIDEQNDIYVDDEGLFGLTDDTMFFQLSGYPQPIAGNGLIVGYDGEGGSMSTTLSAQDVVEKVKFLTIAEVRFSHGSY